MNIVHHEFIHEYGSYMVHPNMEGNKDVWKPQAID